MSLIAVLAGCGRIAFDPRSDAGIDTSADAPVPRCNPQAPFTSITRIDSLSTVPMIDGGARLTPDETDVYFHSDRSGTFQVWHARRASRDVPFEAPTLIAASAAFWPMTTPDQLTLYYSDNADINVATRAAVTDVFPAGTLIAGIDSTATQSNPYLGPRGTTLYFTHYEPDGKIFTAPLPALDSTQVIAEVDTAANESTPTLSDDELVMYFSRETANSLDVFVAQRDSVTSSFGAAVEVTEVNSPVQDSPTWLSRDLCRLYFESARTGDWDIYLAERQP